MIAHSVACMMNVREKEGGAGSFTCGIEIFGNLYEVVVAQKDNVLDASRS